MSSGEDWYPLAANDLQSSSDDEQARQGDDGRGEKQVESVEAFALPTPSKYDVRHAVSPSSNSIDSGCFPYEEVNNEAGRSGKLRGRTGLTCITFDDQLDESDALNGNAQERWQRTDAYMRDVQSAFRTRPAVKVQSHERFMKLLLVGEPGLGKDYFVKNIFAPYCEDNDLPVNCCDPEAETGPFLQRAGDFCTEVVVDIDEGRTKIHYMIQDTPATHLPGAERSILSYVLRQNQEYLAKEEDPKRVVPLSTLPDPRVDICLFFLSPHFLKPQDVVLMTKLSEFVPIVPVIAKADSLTTIELEKYRQHIRERLQNVSLQVGRPVMHTFSASDLKAVGAVREVPPFAIITSSEVDHEVGRHWFTRTFPWGRCEVMSSNHSDLPALKSLLFESCFEGIKAATEARFYSARESHLTSRALSKALSSGELPQAPEANIKSPEVSSSLTSSPEGLRLQAGSSALRGAKPVAHQTASSRASSSKPPQPARAKGKAQQGSSGWGWGLGVTLGVVTVAILLQLAALGAYSKNTAHLRSLVEAYQREAAAEKQVLLELRDYLRSRFGEGKPVWLPNHPPLAALPYPKAFGSLPEQAKRSLARGAGKLKSAGSSALVGASQLLSSVGWQQDVLAAKQSCANSLAQDSDVLFGDIAQGRDLGVCAVAEPVPGLSARAATLLEKLSRAVSLSAKRARALSVAASGKLGDLADSQAASWRKAGGVAVRGWRNSTLRAFVSSHLGQGREDLKAMYAASSSTTREFSKRYWASFKRRMSKGWTKSSRSLRRHIRSGKRDIDVATNRLRKAMRRTLARRGKLSRAWARPDHKKLSRWLVNAVAGAAAL